MSMIAEPKLESALELCVQSLRRLAEYELDPPLQHRLTDLGERKEFLDAEQQQELLALVDFAERRTTEKLQAQVALSRLREALPSLASMP